MDMLGILAAGTILAFTLVRVVVGVWLFAAPLPLRDGASWRVPLTLVCLYGVYLLFSAIFMGTRGQSSHLSFAFSQLATYSLLLVACVGAMLVVYDTNVWTALFCCSAGYTTQNLATGATEFVWTALDQPTTAVEIYGSPLRYVVALICVLLVYVPTYLLATRQNLRTGLGRIENRSMIVMMAVVMLVIIGFDLVIKWLVDRGVPVGASSLLRVFHGLACVFTVFMEFELLIKSRLVAERDTMRQVLAERERQYAQARENMTAINARVHDIRHAVGRMADADGVAGDALRDLIREVEVYDLRVQTGNEALDTVLTERSLTFAREGVTLSCIADGAAVSFMAPADVYALFGCVLDAAAACGGASVSVVVRERMGAVSVHLEAMGEILDTAMLALARDIACRYGGTITTLTRDGTWHINLLFPMQM